jgi:hypothetical protein
VSCNPLATGLVDIEQNYWSDHGENYWQNENKTKGNSGRKLRKFDHILKYKQAAA